MKLRLSLLLVFLLPVLLAASVLAAPVPVTSAELIEKAADFDGKEVTLEGEAVGSILPRGEYAWVNITDQNNSAIGIFMKASDAAQIKTLGRYGVTGDRVRVTGTFYRACAAHGGDLDVHAASVTLVEAGHASVPAVPAWLPPLAVVSAVLAAGFCTVAVLRVRRYNAF